MTTSSMIRLTTEFVKPDGGRIAVIELQHADFIDVSGNDLGNRRVDAVLHEVDFFKADGEDAACVEDEQRDDRRSDVRDIDSDDAADLARAVHARGFVKILRHARQRGEIDDRRIAHRLPYAGPDVQAAEILDIAHEILRTGAKRGKQLIDNACGNIGELEDHRNENDRGNEIGHIR